eukprot:COSAG06_NODE_1616_length_8924_cov_9.604419_3_plen_69_part_00
MCAIKRTRVCNRLGAVAVCAVAAERRNVSVAKAAAVVTLQNKTARFCKHSSCLSLWLLPLFICTLFVS